MHESWEDDDEGYRQKAYLVLKKDCEYMLADCTERVLEEEMPTVHDLMNTISNLVPVVVKSDDAVAVVRDLHPELIKSICVWASVGIRSTFVRAMDVAILNDTLEQE